MVKNKIREILNDILGKKFNISFSKSAEDLQLYKLIGDGSPGAYLDIGSWEPVLASNTYFFYLRNWKGICVDPNPELLKKYKSKRPKDIFINAAVGSSNSSLDYYLFKDKYSSINSLNLEFIKELELEKEIERKIKVPVVSIENILDENLKKTDRLDFFDIDVEGYDLEVLKSNNWDKYRPKLVLIESHLPISEDLDSSLTKYLETKKYTLVGKTIMNCNIGNLIFLNNDYL